MFDSSKPTLTKPITDGYSYVSAPCGSGKSFAAAKYISENLKSGKRFVYVGQSKALLKEFEDRLRNTFGVTAVKNINRDTTDEETVAKAALRELQEEHQEDVVLLTHATFLNLPFIPYLHETQIFIDEIPQIDECFELCLDGAFHWWNEYIEAIPGGALARIKKRKKKTLDRILDSKGAAYEPFQTLLRRINSRKHTVFVLAQDYDRAVNGIVGDPDSRDTALKLTFIAMVNATAFRNCCFLAAGFEESFLFEYLTKERCPPVRATLPVRYENYADQMSQRCVIRYCLESHSFSKSIRKKNTTDGRTVKEAIDETILKDMMANGTSEFLLATNNDDKTGKLANSKSPKPIRLPGKVSGINEYDNHTRIVFIPALNRTTKHYKILQTLGYAKSSITRSTLIEEAHQFIMRTSLRNPNSSETVYAYMADKDTAKRVADVIKCNAVQRIGNIELVSTPKLAPLTATERNRRSVARKTIGGWEGNKGRSLQASSHEESPVSIRENSNETERWKNNDDEDNDHEDTRVIRATICDNVYATRPEDFKVIDFPSTQQFITWIRREARVAEGSKDDAPRFTLTTFKCKAESGYRRQENFEKAYGLIWDFDGGLLSSEAFIDLYWTNAGPLQKQSFILVNTFSRSSDDPNRFRVIFPFKRACKSLEVLQTISKSLAERIAEAGMSLNEAGLDPNYKSGNQVFLYPRTNRQHPDSSLFVKKGTRTQELEAYAIDPVEYQRYIRVKSDETISAKGGSKRHDAQFLADIEGEISTIKAMKDGRRDPLLTLGVKLWHNGFSSSEVYTYLLRIAGDDKRMRDKVYETMCSLHRFKKLPKPLRRR